MTDTAAAFLAALSVVALLIGLAVFLWYAAALSRVFARRDVESWRAWVPLLNEAEILRLGGRPAWAVVFFFIPVVSIYAVVLRAVAAHRIGRTFGRGGGTTTLAVLLPPVWATVLASAREPDAVDSATSQGGGRRENPPAARIAAAGENRAANAGGIAPVAEPPTAIATPRLEPIRSPFLDAIASTRVVQRDGVDDATRVVQRDSDDGAEDTIIVRTPAGDLPEPPAAAPAGAVPPATSLATAGRAPLPPTRRWSPAQRTPITLPSATAASERAAAALGADAVVRYRPRPLPEPPAPGPALGSGPEAARAEALSMRSVRRASRSAGWITVGSIAGACVISVTGLIAIVTTIVSG